MIDRFGDEHRWLSNFWPCKIRWLGNDFQSVEHAYQASKVAFLTGPFEKIDQFLNCTAGQAKRFGDKLKDRLEPRWHERKLGIMEELLRRKYSATNPELRSKLIETEGEELIEGNNWKDSFWGVDAQTRQGENNLGKLLMKIRKELIDEWNDEICRAFDEWDRAGVFGK